MNEEGEINEAETLTDLEQDGVTNRESRKENRKPKQIASRPLMPFKCRQL